MNLTGTSILQGVKFYLSFECFFTDYLSRKSFLDEILKLKGETPWIQIQFKDYKELILNYYSIPNTELPLIEEELTMVLNVFKTNFMSRFRKHHQSFDMFEKGCKDWLEKNVLSSKLMDKLSDIKADNSPHKVSRVLKQGRPKSELEDLTSRSKRRRSEQIRNSNSPAVLLHMSHMILNKESTNKVRNIIKAATKGSPATVTRLSEAVKPTKNKISSYSPEEALSYFRL